MRFGRFLSDDGDLFDDDLSNDDLLDGCDSSFHRINGKNGIPLSYTDLLEFYQEYNLIFEDDIVYDELPTYLDLYDFYLDHYPFWPKK